MENSLIIFKLTLSNLVPVIIFSFLCCSTTYCQSDINSKCFIQEDNLFLVQKKGKEGALNLVRYNLIAGLDSLKNKKILYPPSTIKPSNTFRPHGEWALSSDFFIFDLIIKLKFSNFRILNYFDLPTLDTLTFKGFAPAHTMHASENYFTLGHNFDYYAANPIIRRIDFSLREDGTIYGIVFEEDAFYISKHLGTYWQKPGFIHIDSVLQEDIWEPIKKIKSTADNHETIIQADQDGVYLLNANSVSYLPFLGDESPVLLYTLSSRGKSPEVKWVIDQTKQTIYYAGAELLPVAGAVNLGAFQFKLLDGHPKGRFIAKLLEMNH